MFARTKQRIMLGDFRTLRLFLDFESENHILPKIMSKITLYVLIKNKCIGVNNTIHLSLFILFCGYNLKIFKCKYRIHSFWIIMWSGSFVL